MKITKKLGKNNESVILLIPSTFCEHLGVQAGDEVIVQDDEGKHGKFISMWKK